MTSRDNHGPSALRRIESLCRSYGLSDPSDVRSLQGILKDALVALASAGGHDATLADLKESHVSEKVDFKK